MKIKDLAGMLDISAVRADSTHAEIEQAAALAAEHNCAAVFALPAHTAYVADQLAGTGICVGGVVGFPGGGDTTAAKSAATAELLMLGCREIDMVNNIAWLKAGEQALYQADVRAVVEAAEGLPVKVILECHWLSATEIDRACAWCIEAGAAWVKTGTGWAPTGATVENVARMKNAVAGRCRVKAAGGVGDLDAIMRLIDAGAERFGIGVRTAQSVLAGTKET